MSGRLILGLVPAVTIIVGCPYVTLIINRGIGTSMVVFTERDGLRRSRIITPNVPRPDWLALLPTSIVVQAGHWLPSPGRQAAGELELLTRMGVDEIKPLYRDRLSATGFDINDIGLGSRNAPPAQYLGIANMLEGRRPVAGLSITITTRSAGGLILPSQTQIHWQRCNKMLPGGS